MKYWPSPPYILVSKLRLRLILSASPLFQNLPPGLFQKYCFSRVWQEGPYEHYKNPLSVGWASSGCHVSVRWKSGLKAVRIFPYRLPNWSFRVSLRLICHPTVDILTSTAPVFLCTPPALTLMKTPLHTAIINKIKIYNEIIQTVSSPSNLLKTILFTLILMRELYTHLKQTPRFPVRPPTGKLEEE